MTKSRLDQLLVTRGLAPDLERARALILAGRVHGPSRRYAAPGQALPSSAPIEVTPGREFVSRGGSKLAAALDAWPVQVRNLVCLDIGASTGGFSDCLLQRGARRVYAVDVGYGQLADPLRRDERVVVMERTDARALPTIAPPLDPPRGPCCDRCRLHLPPRGVAGRLIGAAAMCTGDCPRQTSIRGATGPPCRRTAWFARPRPDRTAVKDVALWAIEHRWGFRGVRRSPLRGPKGNKEFLVWLRTPPHSEPPGRNA